MIHLRRRDEAVALVWVGRESLPMMKAFVGGTEYEGSLGFVINLTDHQGRFNGTFCLPLDQVPTKSWWVVKDPVLGIRVLDQDQLAAQYEYVRSDP